MARNGVPGQVFDASWDGGGMAEWLTRLASKTQKLKIDRLKPIPEKIERSKPIQ